MTKNDIRFDTLTEVLKGKTQKPSKFFKIGAKNHQVSKFLQSKATLVSAFDDKSCLFRDLAHLDLMDSVPQHVEAPAQVLCVAACMVVVGLASMSSQERTQSETQDKNLSNSTNW